jgi:hypothetical protein
MKNSDSTEMERLLRRHARRTGETLRGAQGTGDDAQAASGAGSHLDADEMNAYAENALPEAARSRYFAHLADCETCRKLVTDLTLAASVASEGKARVAALEGTPPSKSWREWLATIFSPSVLRYGVPALALSAIIVVVAIVATRSQRDGASVAQNKDESRYTAPSESPGLRSGADSTTATANAQNHSNSNATVFADPQAQPGGVVAAPTPLSNAPVTEAAPVISQETTVAKSTTTTQAEIQTKAGEFGVAGKREQSADEAPPPPAPASQTAPVLAAPVVTDERQDRDRPKEPKKAKAAGKDDAEEVAISGNVSGGARANKTEMNEDRRDVGRAATASGPAQNQPRRRPYATGRSTPSDGVTERERKESSPDQRSVGGRAFQKQGGAWVDTAYNSSRPTTNIRRGSEQYRALVADEPGLRSIAEQLGGEVIVVWKSRAYRFY